MRHDTGAQRHITVLDGYVPVIDLSAATGGGRASVAAAIGRACASSGFFVVVGHGVRQRLIDRMYSVTREFFELPGAEKDKVLSGPGTCGLSYSAGSAAKSMGVDSPPDLCEIFSANLPGDRDAERRRGSGGDCAPWDRANVWPETPLGFRPVWLAYMRAMETLSQDLMRLFGLALGLGEGFFADRADEPVSTVVANFYYPQAVPPLPGQMRKGPHSDWGVLTVLHQDDAGGLQVRQQDGGWRDVPSVPGSFVINIGDMMEFWTGGHWVSTLHRVVNPVEGHTGSRLSIPFFHMPNHDAPIDPVPALGRTGGAGAPDTPGERMTPGRWYAEKMAATYS
ncbi:isopenicillin N synthase family dioxygenase [Streptomyces jumonjinensis]|uniref:Isopenicillin N synthase family oxygenase n=1 Tax=Streptomyces jumonjinensis TaxID=1945 RepID=A0A646KJS8_STRJU|nr:2OG-Fe(II) oxygenase family protein [Streptomyces jumonjinensis]MQT02328.1 isopenicillin N synthase family oxygenase [Streptomyces jumonjinensis]